MDEQGNGSEYSWLPMSLQIIGIPTYETLSGVELEELGDCPCRIPSKTLKSLGKSGWPDNRFTRPDWSPNTSEDDAFWAAPSISRYT